jgi:hypothetical protein
VSTRLRQNASRQLEEQRHVDRLVVEKNAVRGFAVLPERFAVIGHHRDQRVVIQTAQLAASSRSFPTAAST